MIWQNVQEKFCGGSAESRYPMTRYGGVEPTLATAQGLDSAHKLLAKNYILGYFCIQGEILIILRYLNKSYEFSNNFDGP